MKTSELTGAQLDAWVAKAEGYELDADGDNLTIRENGGTPSAWHPSSDWSQGGPIIERERIAVAFVEGLKVTVWHAQSGAIDAWTTVDLPHTGPTALIAAMRAYVSSVFGADVDATLTVRAST